MENGASKAPPPARHGVSDFLSPDALKGPGVLGVVAAGHVALVVNARPQTLLALLEIAKLNPLFGIVCLLVVALVSIQLSRQSQKVVSLVRRMTISLIAGCLLLIAGDVMNFFDAGQQPWSAVIAGATLLVLVGGLTTLIADGRALAVS